MNVMKAAVITVSGGPEVLKIKQVNKPVPSDSQVRIKVHAAGINRPDVIQREGGYPAPEGVPGDIPGLEVAGVIDDIGNSKNQWNLGDRVCALLAGGGYAEYVTVPEGQCLPIPDGTSFAEAASLPETYFTVWSTIMDRGKFQPGETVLIHGGSSGIGTAGIQLVKGMGGTVVITAGTDEKCAYCQKLGADHAINYTKADFEAYIKNELGGVDIILDMVGGDYMPKNVRILWEEGRVVIINAMNGRFAELDLMRIMTKRLIITGATLRSREIAFKVDIARSLKEHVWPLFVSGKIRPVVYKTFPLKEVVQAHQELEAGRHMGKIVLEIA